VTEEGGEAEKDGKQCKAANLLLLHNKLKETACFLAGQTTWTGYMAK
jgi:hypothetical protein